MPTWTLWTIGIILFIAMIGVSIGLHEFAHMFTAKKLKLQVPKFFVGFGPTLFSFKKGKGPNETEYGLKLLPLGGFVDIIDPTVADDKDEHKRLLTHVKPWKRNLIFAAGPLMNIVIGFVLLIALLMTTASAIPTTQIESVNKCSEIAENCAAEKGGLLVGDTILEINGEEINTHKEISPAANLNNPATVVIERNGEIIEKTFMLSEGRLGIFMEIEQRPLTFNESIAKFNEYTVLTIKGIASIPSQIIPTVEAIGGAERDPESSLSSIVGVGQAFGDISASDSITPTSKIYTLLLFTALINFSLGFLNLLPLPPLDGGRSLIATIDSARGAYSKINKKWKYKPLSLSVIKVMTVSGATVLFAFMALIVLVDIVNPLQVV